MVMARVKRKSTKETTKPALDGARKGRDFLRQLDIAARVKQAVRISRRHPRLAAYAASAVLLALVAKSFHSSALSMLSAGLLLQMPLLLLMRRHQAEARLSQNRASVEQMAIAAMLVSALLLNGSRYAVPQALTSLLLLGTYRYLNRQKTAKVIKARIEAEPAKKISAWRSSTPETSPAAAYAPDDADLAMKIELEDDLYETKPKKRKSSRFSFSLRKMRKQAQRMLEQDIAVQQERLRVAQEALRPFSSALVTAGDDGHAVTMDFSAAPMEYELSEPPSAMHQAPKPLRETAATQVRSSQGLGYRGLDAAPVQATPRNDYFHRPQAIVGRVSRVDGIQINHS